MKRVFVILISINISAGMWGCGESDTSAAEVSAAGATASLSYPAGPYGTEIGDVIENVTLITDTEETISLESLHQDPNREIMMIFGTAGWCARCSIHMPTLKALFNDFDTQGVFIALSIHENRGYGPAEPRDAMNFRRTHDLPFPVFADGGAHLIQYYEEVGMPMVMVVDLRTMVLLYAKLTWEPEEVRALMEANL